MLEGAEFFAYGGNNIKAPKVLADIVESLAAAIYVDYKFNLILLWDCFYRHLEYMKQIEQNRSLLSFVQRISGENQLTVAWHRLKLCGATNFVSSVSSRLL